MADPKEVRIYHIVGPVNECPSKQFGIALAVNPITGFRMWYGRDANGDITEWLALDKYARVTTLETTDKVLTNEIDFKQTLTLDPANRRLFWDENEEAPAFYNAVDDVKHILGRSMMTPVCINDTGSPITRGSACRVRQAVGGYPALELATSTTHLFGDLVVFPMRDVADGATVDCLWVGMGEGLNTAGFAANEQLYLSTTPGVLTNVAPADPVFVGRCVVSSSTVGRILYVGTGFGGDLSTFYNKIVDDATAIKMEVGNHDVQHLLDDVIGRGNIDDSGFGFTDDGAGACTIGSGDVYLHTTASKGSTGGVFTVPGDSFTLTDGYNNYIYAEYNAGTPRLQNTINPSAIRYVEDKIIIRIVRRDGTTLRNIPFEPGWQSLSTVLTQQFFEEAEGMGDLFAHRLKGDLISTLGTRSPTLSAGSYRAGMNRIPTPLIDCTAGGTFTSFYGDTANGWTYNAGQTQLNNTQYYNGAGGLATLNTSRYSVRWVWRLFSVTEMFIQISATNIIDQADAIDTPVPTDLPPLVAQFGQLVGRYIVQQGSNTVLSLPRWESTLSSSGVVTHASTVDPNSEPDVQHVNSTPTAGQTGTQVLESSFKTGSTKKFNVSPQGLTYLYTAEDSPAEFDTFNACNGEYLFFGERDSHTFHKFDRASGRILGTVTAASGLGYRSKLIINDEIVVFYGSGIRIINIPLFKIRTVAFSAGSVDATSGSCINSNGDIFAIQGSTGDVYSIVNSGNDSYSASALSVSGLVSPKKIACDNTHYYVLDFDTSYYVKKYDIATNTLQLTSAGFSSPNLFKMIDGEIHIMGSFYYDILNTSLVSVLSTSHGSLSGMKYCDECDGIVYGVNTSTFAIEAYQSPALVEKAPGVTDMSDSKLVKFSENETGLIYTDQDFIRSKHVTDSQNIDRLGCTIMSVETTIPGSPVIGATYLINGGTTQYEGYVIRWTARGEWEVLARGTGARVTIVSTGATYDWTGSAWQQVGILTLTEKTDLTDSGDTTLHYHAADRARANHTGTQTASTISDFDTEVSNNTDVAANTAARHTHANKTTLDTITSGMLLSSTQKTDLTDGGTTFLHQHAPAVIDVDEVTYPTAYVISESERGDVIYLNHGCAAGYSVEVPDSILATPGFRFYVSIGSTQLNANVLHESAPAFGYVMTVPGSGYINTCEFMVVGGKITLISGAATEI